MRELRRNLVLRSRRKFLVGLPAAAAVLAVDRGFSQAVGAPVATAVTQVFGEGMKVTAVVLAYGKAVAGAKLSVGTYRVAGRTVTGVYSSRTGKLGEQAADGRYVVVELSREDAGSVLIQPGPPPAPGGQGGGPRVFPKPVVVAAKASVVQVGGVSFADGTTLASGAAVETTAVKNLIVDDFKQLEYTDAKSGTTLKYNLFVPRKYDKGKAYPLVIFVHDAGMLNANPLVTLMQGLGAVVWAGPEEQAKRECFVVAPQFDAVPGDAGKAAVVGLVESLAGEYNLDRKRLYCTGQSMGATLFLETNVAYPGVFAASFIVAGQMDPEKSAPLAKDKLWIVVSQGDERAYPTENAMTAVWEKAGAKVNRAVWNGKASPAEFTADVKAMEVEGTAIHYAALQKETVVPAGQRDDGGSNHINTWRIAYTIEGVREWLFQQRG